MTDNSNIRKRKQADSDVTKHQIHLEMIQSSLVAITDGVKKEGIEKKQLLNQIISLQEVNASYLEKTKTSYDEMVGVVNQFGEQITGIKKYIPQSVANIEANNEKHQKAISIKIGWIMWFTACIVFTIFCFMAKILIS